MNNTLRRFVFPFYLHIQIWTFYGISLIGDGWDWINFAGMEYIVKEYLQYYDEIW